MIWRYVLERVTHDYDGVPCAQRGDEQQCNGAASYMASASASYVGTKHSKQIRLCPNHAARLAHKHGLPFPVATSVAS